jgi:glycosyltransferase involved in cell wall biosynthesis
MYPLIHRQIRDAAALLYIGTQNRKYYELFGAKSEQLFFAPWEIDYSQLEQYYSTASQKRTALRNTKGWNEKTCIIITASRLVSVKGYNYLVPAIAKAKTSGCQARLVIAGEGSYRPVIESHARQTNAPIEFLGNLNRQQLVEAMVAADIFVLASTREPWGLVVNEAALCGLPIIVSNAVGAGTDLVHHGKNGLIYEWNNTNALADAIRSLAGNGKMRIEMGQHSRQLIDEWRTKYPALQGYRTALNATLEISERHLRTSKKKM